jgi:hypothetical protein
MNVRSNDRPGICTYVPLDDLLVLTKGDWTDHLTKLEQVLSRLAQASLKVNATKSFFGHTETEYLGFWIMHHGIRPITKKVEAIQQLQPPTMHKQLWHFIGLVNYYCDMWRHRSELLAPLSTLTSKKTQFVWTDTEQKAFECLKTQISKDVLLSYPDFSKPFNIHTDVSKIQLGAAISQNHKPIAFYLRKLNPAQTRYMVAERELLSIVETLKEFHNILLGQQLHIYMDHQNLMHNNFTMDHVMRWRLLIEEYAPTFHHIKGKNNTAADALSHLPFYETCLQEHDYNAYILAECYDMEPDKKTFPLTFKYLCSEQWKDDCLQYKLVQGTYCLQSFH